jgi:hypothetical protein
MNRYLLLLTSALFLCPAILPAADSDFEALDREAAKSEAAEAPAPKPAPKPAFKPAPLPPAKPAPKPEPVLAPDPADKGISDIQKTLEAVGSGQEAIEKLDSALDKAREYVTKADLPAPDKEQLLAKIDQIKDGLAGNTGLYTRFASAAGKTKDVLDLVVEARDLKKTMDEYSANQGQGAANLALLAFVAEKVGGSVPILGDAIAGYGKITKGILEATDKLSKSINENQRQVAVGDGGQRSGEKFDALQIVMGADAKNFTWLPTTPGWIYTPLSGNAPDLLWDSEHKTWIKVPKDSAESVYWKAHLAGTATTPAMLAAMCEPAAVERAKEREAAAVELLQFVRTCRGNLGDAYLALSSVDTKSGALMRSWLSDPEGFAIKYAYNGYYKADAHAAFLDLYGELAKRLPADSKLLASMRSWAITQGLKMAGTTSHAESVLAAYRKVFVDWKSSCEDLERYDFKVDLEIKAVEKTEPQQYFTHDSKTWRNKKTGQETHADGSSEYYTLDQLEEAIPRLRAEIKRHEDSRAREKAKK